MAKSVVDKAPKFDPATDLNDLASLSKYFQKYDATDAKGRYLHWSQLKWRVPKGEAHDIWKVVKLKRLSQMKCLPLKDPNGRHFSYCTPPSLEAMLHQIGKLAGGHDGATGETGAASKLQGKFLVPSLIMEEAITSAQLEGAATTREVAKKMLEDERDPVTEDERMILNNYLLLRHAQKICHEDLSVDQILEFHRIATAGTTGNNVVPGEFRKDNTIYVEDGHGNIAHQPPDFQLIPERLSKLCEFANTDHSGQAGNTFIAPVVKAIILHFMMGYEHPFRDGNGRTARALFYWYMLKRGYNLFKYVSISKPLKQQPKDYGLSYMYTEDDQNDLTYFICFQAEIILAALKDLESHLIKKSRDFQRISELLEGTEWNETLNFVQKDLIKKAVKDPGRIFTAKEVSNTYSISQNTARSYLQRLVDNRLFLLSKDGKTVLYMAPANLAGRLAEQ